MSKTRSKPITLEIILKFEITFLYLANSLLVRSVSSDMVDVTERN